MNPRRLLKRLTEGAFSNVAFSDAQKLTEALGFNLERIGSSRHHIYKHPDLTERLNLQPLNGQAKEYQLRQLLALVEQYDLKLKEDR